MSKYAINDLTRGIYNNPTIYIEADSPKKAVEKALNCKVKRVYSGGNIVCYNCHCGSSYVYERTENKDVSN